MKIGILTFHCAHNYGAVLQCYALQEYLKGLGHEAYIINYRPKYLLSPYQLIDKKRILSKNPLKVIYNIIKETILFIIRYRRYKGFEGFINKHLNLTKIVRKDAIPSDYDAYIVGSDQIWNPKITRGFDDIYFCNFPFPKGNKKYISYAASMESKSLENKAKSYYEQMLKNFDHISVRESDLLQLLQPLTTTSIKHVLDPTLMVQPSIWNKLISNHIPNEKNVVVYQVRNNKNTLRIAKHIAQQLGAIVIELTAWVMMKQWKAFQDATPIDYLNLIRNASCVITTSFHGTAFSLIFNRPFYTIKLNDGADSRSNSILTALHLEDRMISTDSLPTFSEIDYSIVNNRLNKFRKYSQCFLKETFNENCN